MLVALSLYGCVQSPPSFRDAPWARVPMGQTSDVDQYWFAACFRMPWDGEGRPEWAVDAALAREVIMPLLQKFGDELGLWRFHRRAGRDATGHQFTLLMYTSASVAEDIQQQISDSPVVTSLQRAGHVTAVLTTCRGDAPSPVLSAHSDPGWHPHIQRAWPYFIMGVSANWLALIDGVSTEIGSPEGASVPEMLRHYRQVHEEVTALWQGQGQHAYIHHLSALFAYEPLLIQRFIGF